MKNYSVATMLGDVLLYSYFSKRFEKVFEDARKKENGDEFEKYAASEIEKIFYFGENSEYPKIIRTTFDNHGLALVGLIHFRNAYTGFKYPSCNGYDAVLNRRVNLEILDISNKYIKNSAIKETISSICSYENIHL